MESDIHAGAARRNRHRSPAFIAWLLWFLVGIVMGLLLVGRWSSDEPGPVAPESPAEIREEVGVVIAITMDRMEWKDFHGRFGPCWLVARSTGQAPALLPIGSDGIVNQALPAGQWRFTLGCDALVAEDHRPWELWVGGGKTGQPMPLMLDFPLKEEATIHLKLPNLSGSACIDLQTWETYHLAFWAKTPETIQSLLKLGGWPLQPRTVKCGQRLAIRSMLQHENAASPARLIFRMEENEAPGIRSICDAFLGELTANNRLPESENYEMGAIDSIPDMVGFFQPRLSRSRNRAEYMFWKSLQELKWLSMNSERISPRTSSLRVHLLADSGSYLYRWPNPSGSDDLVWLDQRGARFFSRDACGREHLLLSPPKFDIMLLAGQSTSGLPRLEYTPTNTSN